MPEVRQQNRSIALLEEWQKARKDLEKAHSAGEYISQFEVREKLVRRYSWSVPTEEALQMILDAASGRPIVEVGCGTGYWLSLLAERGARVHAYDLSPPSPESEANHWHKKMEPFVPIHVGDHDVLRSYGHALLLLSWPPYDEPFGSQALTAYHAAGGQVVAYIGEGAGGCTGDEAMFCLLGQGSSCYVHDYGWDSGDYSCLCERPAAQWRCIDTLTLPQWEGIHDYLSIYHRTP